MSLITRRLVIAATVVLLAVEVVLVAPSLSGAVTALLSAQVGWVLAAVVAAAVSMSMFARSRRRLLRAAGVSVRARSALAAVYGANAMHLTLPGGAAFSTAYTFRWMRHAGANGPAATWTLVAGGVVQSATLAAVGLLGSLLVGSSSGVESVATAAAAVLLVVLVVRHLQRRPGTVLAVGRWTLGRVNAVRRRPADTGVTSLETLLAQMQSVRPGSRDWAIAGGFSLANWAFDVACLAASGAALGVQGMTLPWLLVAYTAGMAASSLSLLPGGIGVVDAALVLTLVAGGIPAASALPAVLLYRLISLVGVVAVGWAVAGVQSWRSSAEQRPVLAGTGRSALR